MISLVQSELGVAQRVSQLEDRVAELEAQARTTRRTTSQPRTGPDGMGPERPWALEALRARHGAVSTVLFAGSVRLPTDTSYEWQQAFDTASLLDADWSLVSDVLAALGHPVRLVVLREVLRGNQTVADLSGVEGFGTSGQLYHHLRHLVAAGWLRTAGRGRYEVPAVRVIPLLVVLAAAQR